MAPWADLVALCATLLILCLTHSQPHTAVYLSWFLHFIKNVNTPVSDTALQYPSFDSHLDCGSCFKPGVLARGGAD